MARRTSPPSPMSTDPNHNEREAKGDNVQSPYNRAERRLLRELCPPGRSSQDAHGDEFLSGPFLSGQERERLLERVGRQRQMPARVARRRNVLARHPIAAAATTLLLLSAGVWTWSGRNSNDLDLPSSLRVLRSTQHHTEENLLAAIGKVGRELAALIDGVQANGSMTPTLRQQCARAFDSPPAGPYRAPVVADLARVLAQQGPLNATDTQVVLLTLATCRGVLEEVAKHSANCQVYVTIAVGDVKQKLQ